MCSYQKKSLKNHLNATDYNQRKKDEERAKAVLNYLWNAVLPTLTSQICEK